MAEEAVPFAEYISKIVQADPLLGLLAKMESELAQTNADLDEKALQRDKLKAKLAYARIIAVPNIDFAEVRTECDRAQLLEALKKEGIKAEIAKMSHTSVYVSRK